ncbi:MAG: protoheme IX farnesyltransferase [Phycisphaerae bacterium]|nr:MAG: protoheme IX farnesyltransferase [Phycisphaerae bacterium]
MGITRLVTITAAVGFVMAALTRAWSWSLLLAGTVALLGTALSAAGANAVNQWMERARDGRMERTKGRPLPSGRVTPGAVLWSGVALCALGVGLLFVAGPAPAVISLACVVSYVAMYTPLKTRSSLNTFVGAIPGALPPLIGTSAALGGGFESLSHPIGLSLFAIMFVWQLPHFLAIAWLYREDYEAGGYVMLPHVDPDGRVTAGAMTLWSWALVPASLLPAVFMPEVVGVVYPIVAIVTGLVYAVFCVRLALTRRRADARVVFFASIAHLPLLLIVMVGEGVARSVLT